MKRILKSSQQQCWNEPGQLLLKVALALAYFVGLVAFQRYTGLLDLHKSEAGNAANVRLARSLLSLENDNETAIALNNSNHSNSTNGSVEAEVIDPLFPKDLFTLAQIRSVLTLSSQYSSPESYHIIY